MSSSSELYFNETDTKELLLSSLKSFVETGTFRLIALRHVKYAELPGDVYEYLYNLFGDDIFTKIDFTREEIVKNFYYFDKIVLNPRNKALFSPSSLHFREVSLRGVLINFSPCGRYFSSYRNKKITIYSQETLEEIKSLTFLEDVLNFFFTVSGNSILIVHENSIELKDFLSEKVIISRKFDERLFYVFPLDDQSFATFDRKEITIIQKGVSDFHISGVGDSIKFIRKRHENIFYGNEKATYIFDTLRKTNKRFEIYNYSSIDGEVYWIDDIYDIRFYFASTGEKRTIPRTERYRISECGMFIITEKETLIEVWSTLTGEIYKSFERVLPFYFVPFGGKKIVFYRDKSELTLYDL